MKLDEDSLKNIQIKHTQNIGLKKDLLAQTHRRRQIKLLNFSINLFL